MTLTPPASRQVQPPASQRARPPVVRRALSHQKLKRLTLPGDYRRVYRQGKSVTARFLRLYFAPNRIKHFRLGVVVSKRISKKAVERNWHKRLIKEWFRQHALLASREQSDIVIVVIKAACATPRGSAELRKELAVLVQQVFK